MADVLGDGVTLALISRAFAVATGIWLMFAPAVLGHDGTAMADSDRIVGPIAASLAFVAGWQVLEGLRWATVPCGLWAVTAPWILDADLAAGLSSKLAGVVFVLTATVAATGGDRFGGGWRSVRPSAWRTGA